MPSMIGGHRFLVSLLTSLEMVRASVSSRCTRLSASFSGARAASSLARASTWPASLACAVASDSARFCCAVSMIAGEFREVAEPAGFLRELLLLAGDVGDFLIEPRQPVAMGPHIAFELVALGGEVGEHGGQFGEQPLGGGQRRLGLGDAFIDAAALFDARLDLFLQLGVFAVEPLQRHLGVRGLLLLAFDIGGKLHQPAVEFGDALLGALFLAVERFRAHW